MLILNRVESRNFMSRGYVKVTAEQLKKRERRIKYTIRTVIILIVLLILFFLILTMIYQGGDFIITLDPQFSLESGLKMYDDDELKDEKIKLYASGMDFMDNISIKWLPNNLGDQKGGSHNGENFIAYTFFLENTGSKKVDYWYELSIVKVIKSVDEAVRIMIIHNGEETVYAKMNAQTKEPEPDTKAFHSEKIAVLEQRKDIKVNEMDKITIVMWIEGDDPDCLDNIIGGELKTKVRIIESHTEEGSKK